MSEENDTRKKVEEEMVPDLEITGQEAAEQVKGGDFRSLPPEERKSIAHDMVKVGSAGP